MTDYARDTTFARPVEWDRRTAWQRYCGFLDLSRAEFLEIQERLLMEQLRLVSENPLAAHVIPSSTPRTVDEFRQSVPLTTFADYSSVLSFARGSANGSDYMWAQTLIGAGEQKWCPFTRQGYERFLDSVMAAMLMAAAERPGDVRIGPGDTILYNVPPRPYLSGIGAFGLASRFGLRGVLDPATSEALEFDAKVKATFDAALRTGVDVILSMTSVLRRVAERFESGGKSGGSGLNSRRLNGAAIGRLAKAKVKSMLARRAPQPKDIWAAKAIIGWGLDTGVFSDEIEEHWGQAPFELYAATESGVMGVQPTAGAGMVFTPYSGFLEFIPESELEVERLNPGYQPRTALLDEIEPGGTYEVVTTNFYGMPLLRYRPGHLVSFSKSSSAACEFGAEFQFIGRSDSRIDIGGFTRLDERTVWQAIQLAGLPVNDWTMTRDESNREPVIRFYCETRDGLDEAFLNTRLHETLRSIDPLYRDLEALLGVRPLRATVLPAGTFSNYTAAKRRAGEPIAAWKPARMNPDADELSVLMEAATAVAPAALAA